MEDIRVSDVQRNDSLERILLRCTTRTNIMESKSKTNEDLDQVLTYQFPYRMQLWHIIH